MKARWMKLFCVGMIAMLLVSCMHKPIAQKEDPEDFPILKMEKVFTGPTDENIIRPLLLHGNQYFYRDFDFDTHQEHYLAINIDLKKTQWDKTYPDLEFPLTEFPQLIQDLVLWPSTNGDKYSPESKILALNKDTGSIKWQFRIDDTYGDIVLIQKTLFVTSWIRIYALDFQTGKLLWKKSIYDFFPGYSKEKDYYHIGTVLSNQNTLFLGYTLETDMTKDDRTVFKGCLAIQPVNGSILWKYEKEYKEWSGIEEEDFEIIGSYLLAYGFTTLDTKNGKKMWQYKPEDLEYKDPETFFVGYVDSEKLLIYRTTYEVRFEEYGTTLTGLDIGSGKPKWKQEAKEEGDSQNSQNLFCIDENHQTNQIFMFNSSLHENQTLIDNMDVYDSKDGKLLQSYEMPVSYWIRVLKSEIRFHQGWWYFIGTSSTNGGDQDNLFRFQLNQ